MIFNIIINLKPKINYGIKRSGDVPKIQLFLLKTHIKKVVFLLVEPLRPYPQTLVAYIFFVNLFL